MGSGHSIYWTSSLDQPQARFVANAVRGTRGEEPPSPCRFGVATLHYHRNYRMHAPLDYQTTRMPDYQPGDQTSRRVLPDCLSNA